MHGSNEAATNTSKSIHTENFGPNHMYDCAKQREFPIPMILLLSAFGSVPRRRRIDDA